MSHRADRLAHEIRIQVSMILAGEVRDPRVALATVTDAEMSPDPRYAKVFVSIYGNDEEKRTTLAALQKASGFVRRHLGSRLRLRHSPELTFCFDQSVEQGARIEEVLSEVKKEMPDPGEPDGGDTSATPSADD